MKKGLLIFSIFTAFIIAGFLIPLKSFQAFDCVEPATVRLHFIKGDSINKARAKNGAFSSIDYLAACANNEPTKYKLYLL